MGITGGLCWLADHFASRQVCFLQSVYSMPLPLGARRGIPVDAQLGELGDQLLLFFAANDCSTNLPTSIPVRH